MKGFVVAKALENFHFPRVEKCVICARIIEYM